jgi:malic enzyme
MPEAGQGDAARRDGGTGRTDYPNQVNNVLCFPFIFRGALDVRRHDDQRGDEARGRPRHRQAGP